MEKEEVSVSQEISNFIVDVLRLPSTKENPAMVAAIAELYKVIIY
ncbi:MAG: hypothetical protein ACRCZN_09960 [Lactococcus lactis]